jgi:hypothetical protein
VKRLSDTSPEAERVLLDAYRKMPFDRKWRQMGAIYRTARLLHAAGVRSRAPDATREEIRQSWMAATLDDALLQAMEGRPVNGNDESLPVIREVIAVLTRLGIPYALGGSWASSIQGKMRFTHDADMTVEPFPGREEDLCAAFGEDYYVSLPAVQQAVRDRSSFNIVHTPTTFKVDLFVRKDRPFEQSVMQRRQARFLADAPGQALQFVSPEDIILFKLEWYRLGNETSERQWTDVLGVLEVQAGRLDEAYLDHWAAQLQVADLLSRARQEIVAG